MARFHDWPERLSKFIESRRNVPFKWGENDCALFAADCVLELTGIDHAEGMRGNYQCETYAAQLVRLAGGMRTFAQRLTEKHLGHVQRGDVVLAVINGRETYGIAVGNGQWCSPGVTGLVFRPMSDVIHAFE